MIKVFFLIFVLSMLALSATAKEISDTRLTPLMGVIHENDMAKLSEMLKSNVDPNEKNKDGLTPLYLSIVTCNPKAVQMLLESGTTQEKVLTIPPLSFVSKCSDNSVSFKIVEQLVKHGLPKDHIDEDGYMPTLIAFINANNTELVQLLVKYGASVNVESEDGFTALTAAALHGQADIVRLLYESGAKPKHADDLVGYALRNPEILELVLSNGIDKKVFDEIREKHGMSIIEAAFNVNIPESIILLIENGVSVDETSSQGITPLIYASLSGHVELVRFLLAKGADISLKDKAGHDALYYAKANNHIEIVKLLGGEGSGIAGKTEEAVQMKQAEPTTPVQKPKEKIGQPTSDASDIPNILWLWGLGALLTIIVVVFVVRSRRKSSNDPGQGG